MNKVIISGRLTKDVEMSRTVANIAVGRFCIAVNEYAGKDNTGKSKYSSSFINCSVFKEKAEVLERYFKKGDYILLVGRLKQTKYKSKNGNDVNYVEVIVEDFDFTPKPRDNNTIETPKVLEEETPTEDGDLTDEDLPF